jgi:hypothetical protein
MSPAAADVVRALRRGRVVQIGTAPGGAARDSNPQRDYRRVPDNRSTSARNEQVRQDSNPDPRGWSSRCSRYTTDLERTTRIERASPSWQPGALPIELRPHEEPPAGIEPALRPYKGRVLAVDTTEALAPVARTFGSGGGLYPAHSAAASPPLRRATPRQLASSRVRTRRKSGDAGSRTRSSSLQARCSFQMSYIPKVRTGRFERPQHEGDGVTAR